MGRRMRTEVCIWVRRRVAKAGLTAGHALNKILKDFILRFQVLQRRRVHYMPGWDCHGLPIEAKAVAESGETDLSRLVPEETRAAARRVAQREMSAQRREFQSFSIMADWDEEHTYRTMDLPYVVEQLRLFADCVDRGLVYQRYRPVYWSPSSRTALAEAEVEYDEHHVSRSVYVLAQLHASDALAAALGHIDEPIHLAVWTTTPWSLLGNMVRVWVRDVLTAGDRSQCRRIVQRREGAAQRHALHCRDGPRRGADAAPAARG